MKTEPPIIKMVYLFSTLDKRVYLSKSIRNELLNVCLLVLFIVLFALLLKNSAEARDSANNKKIADIHQGNGLAYMLKDEHQKAILEFTKAIKFNPNDEISYGGRGNAYHILGSLQQAIRDYEKAIELNTNNADIYSCLGNAYYSLGNYQKAVNNYSKGLGIKPKDANNALDYRLRGQAQYKLNNFEQAVNDWKIAAKNGDKIASDILKANGVTW